MEEKSSFFKFIWRLNSIIILAIGIIGLIVLIYGSYEIFKSNTSKRAVSSIVNIEKDSNLDEHYKLGQNNRVFNSKYIVTSLVSVQNYEQSYYSKSASSIKNYLFTNIDNSNSSWLFDSNKNLILNLYPISKKRLEDKIKDTKALMYKIVSKDSNSDGRLTYKDRFTMAFSDIGGKNYREVLSDIQSLSSWNFVNNDEVIVLYQKNNTIYSSNIDLKEFKILNTKTIPEI